MIVLPRETSYAMGWSGCAVCSSFLRRAALFGLQGLYDFFRLLNGLIILHM